MQDVPGHMLDWSLPAGFVHGRETCTLQFMSKHLYLWTMVRDTDQLLMEHFLRHYLHLGVNLHNQSEVLLHVTGQTEEFLEMMKLMQSFNMTRYKTCTYYGSTLKFTSFNRYILTLPEDAWVLGPDVDEFFQFPCDIQQRITSGAVNFWGTMAERLGADFTIPALQPSPSILQQYPISCPNLRHHLSLTRGHALVTWKYALLKTRVLGGLMTFRGNHHINITFPDPALASSKT
eukprot:4931860-Amphidinium_carterae.1